MAGETLVPLCPDDLTLAKRARSVPTSLMILSAVLVAMPGV